MAAARTVRRPARVVVTAVPDRRRRLSEGMLVEASIIARVLGAKLLSLEASIVVLPAAPRAAPVARGRGLADAVRSLDEGAAILDEARRNGSF